MTATLPSADASSTSCYKTAELCVSHLLHSAVGHSSEIQSARVPADITWPFKPYMLSKVCVHAVEV